MSVNHSLSLSSGRYTVFCIEKVKGITVFANQKLWKQYVVLHSNEKSWNMWFIVLIRFLYLGIVFRNCLYHWTVWIEQWMNSFLSTFSSQDPTYSCTGVQPFGISGPYWMKKSCLGPHIKYIATHNHKKIS